MALAPHMVHPPRMRHQIVPLVAALAACTPHPKNPPPTSGGGAGSATSAPNPSGEGSSESLGETSAGTGTGGGEGSGGLNTTTGSTGEEASSGGDSSSGETTSGGGGEGACPEIREVLFSMLDVPEGKLPLFRYVKYKDAPCPPGGPQEGPWGLLVAQTKGGPWEAHGIPMIQGECGIVGAVESSNANGNAISDSEQPLGLGTAAAGWAVCVTVAGVAVDCAALGEDLNLGPVPVGPEAVYLPVGRVWPDPDLQLLLHPTPAICP